jgi:hypothetical protein
MNNQLKDFVLFCFVFLLFFFSVDVIIESDIKKYFRIDSRLYRKIDSRAED